MRGADKVRRTPPPMQRLVWCAYEWDCMHACKLRPGTCHGQGPGCAVVQRHSCVLDGLNCAARAAQTWCCKRREKACLLCDTGLFPWHAASRQVLFLDVAPDALVTHTEGARTQTDTAQRAVLEGGQVEGTRLTQREQDSIDQELGQGQGLEVQPSAQQDEQGAARTARGPDSTSLLQGTVGKGMEAAVRTSNVTGGRAALMALQAAVAGHFDGLRWGRWRQARWAGRAGGFAQKHRRLLCIIFVRHPCLLCAVTQVVPLAGC